MFCNKKALLFCTETIYFSTGECLGFLDQRKWAKMQWVQDPSQSNVDNLNSVRCEVSRHFGNKKEGIFES